MAAIGTFKAFAVLLAVALFSAAAFAQDVSMSPSSQPPAPDVGASGSVSSSVALIGASVVLSMLAIMKK